MTSFCYLYLPCAQTQSRVSTSQHTNLCATNLSKYGAVKELIQGVHVQKVGYFGLIFPIGQGDTVTIVFLYTGSPPPCPMNTSVRTVFFAYIIHAVFNLVGPRKKAQNPIKLP